MEENLKTLFKLLKETPAKRISNLVNELVLKILESISKKKRVFNLSITKLTIN